jgi:hypothetical protein
MLTIITLFDKRSRTHIAKGVVKGKQPKNTLCGCTFKRTHIKLVIEGNVEACSCQTCVNVLTNNLNLFLE